MARAPDHAVGHLLIIDALALRGARDDRQQVVSLTVQADGYAARGVGEGAREVCARHAGLLRALGVVARHDLEFALTPVQLAVDDAVFPVGRHCLLAERAQHVGVLPWKRASIFEVPLGENSRRYTSTSASGRSAATSDFNRAMIASMRSRSATRTTSCARAGSAAPDAGLPYSA